MKKSFLGGTLACVMLAAVLVAGCTSPTTPLPTPILSVSPTVTPTPQNVSQYLSDVMQRRNFTMITPFSLQPSSQAGIAVYNGTVRDSNGTYVVSVKACNNAQIAQTQFTSLRDVFMRQGYATVQQNATMWLGFNASAGRGAAVEHGISLLMPYYCMVITGGTIGQAPLQERMWTHVWDEMHQFSTSGFGMGPYTGLGINANLRTTMQQEMEEHMETGFGAFGAGMMGV